jgi:hypothetical protein
VVVVLVVGSSYCSTAVLRLHRQQGGRGHTKDTLASLHMTRLKDIIVLHNNIWQEAMPDATQEQHGTMPKQLYRGSPGSARPHLQTKQTQVYSSDVSATLCSYTPHTDRRDAGVQGDQRATDVVGESSVLCLVSLVQA